MAVVAVLILGFTDSISVAIRRTVVQLLAPDGMLGRAASLITVFAQTTNGLGALLAGIAAEYLGAPNALLFGSGLCFVMILASASRSRNSGVIDLNGRTSKSSIRSNRSKRRTALSDGLNDLELFERLERVQPNKAIGL